MRSRTLAIFLALGTLGTAGRARAHWCDDLWASSYNIVVRPAADTLAVPASGTASLAIFVQNNMGYPLPDFELTATATGFSLTLGSDAPKVAGYLLPGEKLRYTLTASRTGSAGSLAVDAVTFYIQFGASGQSDCYGRNGTGVLVRRTDGTLEPPAPVPFPAMQCGETYQGLHLQSSAKADFTDLAANLTSLFAEYCAGRDSWQASNGRARTADYCPDATTTVCPPTANRGNDATKYDWQHLWAAGELAYRKSVLSAQQLATLRTRLQCGWADEVFGMKAFVTFVLGYVGGSDSGVQTFLAGKVANGTDNEKAIAKAALLLTGNTQYRQDVVNGMSAGDPYVEMVCGAALGITEGNDAAVDAELIPRARWLCPGGCGSNDPSGFTAAHLLNIVAWHRRGWQPDAGDTGAVTFYEGGANVAPAAPTGVTCTITPAGYLRIEWNPVTLDEDGAPEVVSGYRLYWGPTPNSCPNTCTRPGQGFDYPHVGNTSETWLEPAGLSANATYYFAVAAVDAQAAQSVFSSEIQCVAPVPPAPPQARITCDATSGTAPVTFVCHSRDSTDPNGDIAHSYFSVDGGTPAEQNQVSLSFDSAGRHALLLRVVDSGGRQATAVQELLVTSAGGGNVPPVAVAVADPTSGPAPLVVAFSSATSSDPDGQPLSFAWSFGDGGTSSQSSANHTFARGVYDVVLTATDNGTPPLQGFAIVTITVSGEDNHPPDATTAWVRPTAGRAPLEVALDATGCSDPDGQSLTHQWTISDDSGALATLADAASTYRFDHEGVYVVSLAVSDDGLPPLASERSFQVTVTPPALTPAAVMTSCSCHEIPTASAVVLLALVGSLAIWRRRAQGRRQG